MGEQVKFKKLVFDVGGSKGITIPPQLAEFLDIKQGDHVILTGQNKSKGKFIAIFKEEEN